jgi:replicative DNA helicase
MTPVELEELLIHIIRVPAVYTEARRFIEIDDWDPHSERHYRILIDCFFKLGDSKLYPVGGIPHVAIDTEARRMLEDDPMLQDTRFLINDIVGRPTDPDPYNGLLHHAYKGVAEDDLSMQYGLTLLKKFLQERQVMDKVCHMIVSAGGRNVIGFAALTAKIVVDKNALIEAVGQVVAVSLADRRQRLVARLEAARGKAWLGLQTGMVELDERTDGLRGLIVVVAAPGVGKTAMAVQIAVGVADRCATNNAVIVFVSLEMDADEIHARIASHLADLDWTTLHKGSPEFRGQPHGVYYNQMDDEKFEKAMAKLDGEVGRRIRMCDREELLGAIDAARLASLLAEAKAATGATRALLIVDFLQLIEVPAAVQKQGDLAADDHRIQIMKDVVKRTGDTALVIAEARKPSDNKQEWGGELADIKGSSRTAFIADAVIQYRRMKPADVRRVYGLESASSNQVAQRLAQLDKDGIAPMMVALTKGRDGMRRGTWPMEFLYLRSTWREPVVEPSATGGMLGIAISDKDDKMEAARKRILEALAAGPLDGETAAALAKAAKIAAGLARAILDLLVAQKIAVEVKVTRPHGKNGKGSKTWDGYRLAELNGQPAASDPDNGSSPE